jgi:glycosyltransferase involved in cell wall biosynthesis
MKISMLMSLYGEHAIGGAERIAERLSLGLQAAGHDLEILSLGAPGSSIRTIRMPNGLAHTQVPLAQVYDPYTLSGQGPTKRGALSKALWHGVDVYNPVMGSRLAAHWTQTKPDLVVTHTLQGFSVSAWRAAKTSGAALAHVIHDHALLCPGTAMTRGTRMCESPCASCSTYGRLRHMLSDWPDAVAAPSHDVMNRHLQWGWFTGGGQRQVIENSIPVDWPEVQTGVELGDGPMRFAFLGRMDESKGVDTLLQAASLLSGHAFEVHLAGPGEVVAMRQQIEQMGLTAKVFVHGVVKAADFLLTQHVVVTPSRARESFCNVVLEAACLGRPGIVANRGALPERTGNGQWGWVFEAGDPVALAGRMSHCIENPAEVHRMGQLGLSCRERNTQEVVQGQWLKFCEAVPMKRAPGTQP